MRALSRKLKQCKPLQHKPEQHHKRDRGVDARLDVRPVLKEVDLDSTNRGVLQVHNEEDERTDGT